MPFNTQGESQLKTRDKLHDPELYDVILLNDDFTTMEFVVNLLVAVFDKNTDEAFAIMMKVHKQGKGVAGSYVHDIAMTKYMMARTTVRESGYPLRIIIEKH